MSNTINGLGGNFFMPAFTYRHNGSIWQSEAGLAHSQSARWRKDASKGAFNTSTAQRTGLTVSFDDIFYLRPNRITVADGVTGAPVDPYQLDGYRLTAAGTNAFEAIDLQRTAYANLKRSFFGSVPLTLKAGGELNQKYPGGITELRARLEAEGHEVQQKGKRFFVADFEKRLFKKLG